MGDERDDIYGVHVGLGGPSIEQIRFNADEQVVAGANLGLVPQDDVTCQVSFPPDDGVVAVPTFGQFPRGGAPTRNRPTNGQVKVVDPVLDEIGDGAGDARYGLGSRDAQVDVHLSRGANVDLGRLAIRGKVGVRSVHGGRS